MLGITAQLLNARPESVERESEIIAQAGRLGAVTVATNMAGRGTDIVLGGSARGIARALARRLLLVRLGVEAPSSPTVALAEATAPASVAEPADVQAQALRLSSPVDDSDLLPSLSATEGESADFEPSLAVLAQSLDLWLPVQPSAAAELALQQAVASCAAQLSIMPTSADRVNARLMVEDVIAQACDAADNLGTSVSPSLPTISTAATPATTATTATTATAVSAAATSALRAALETLTAEFDPVVRRDREAVRALGGLYVVGTARHESRRIDDQLRGRAGRQGDPGSSRFFLSLEDDMFRAFGAEKMAGECMCALCKYEYS